jgi:hypothetical protein
MNSSQAVEAALRLVDPVPTPLELPSVRTALRLAIKPALERVAIRVANDRQYRNLLRKNLGTVAVSNGTADLSTLLTSDDPILLDEMAIRIADIRDSSGNKIQMLADRASLDQDRPTAFKYGAVEGSTLYTDATGTLTVIANYIEMNVEDLKLQLIPMLLEEMVAGFVRVKQAA